MGDTLQYIRSWLGGSRWSRTSFEGNLRLCYKSLYLAALRFAGNPDDAEDLLQEAVVRAYRSWDHFEKGTNFKAWMWRILTNQYITHYRQRQRRGDDLSLDSIDTDLWRNTGAEESGPEELVLERVLDGDLQNALDELPETIRTVMIMTEIEEMPYQDVAAVLGIPLGTVRSRLFRGRALMRNKLVTFAAERGLAGDG